MNLVYFNLIILFISILAIEVFKKKKNFLIVFDAPDNKRKIHKKPIPLIGGPIIFINQIILLGFITIILNFKIKLSIIIFKFYEVPISYYGRNYDEGKKIRIIDAFIAVYCIFKYSIFSK